MPDKLALQIKNTLAEISSANSAVTHWLRARRVPVAADYLANLAIEEHVTNCIKYGYDDAGEHLIEIDLELSDTELVIHITDDGHPFNPLELPEPDTSVPLEQRKPGGIGIHLLRKLSDRMEHERIGEKNRLTLCKNIAGSVNG